MQFAPLRHTKEPLGLSDANARTVKVKGATVLTVALGEYTSRAPFLFVERVSTNVILGCDCIERNVEEIVPNNRMLVLKDNTKVLIHRIAWREWKPPSPMRATPIERNPLRHCRHIYAARRMSVSPQGEKVIGARYKDVGELLLEPGELLFTRITVRVTNGLI